MAVVEKKTHHPHTVLHSLELDTQLDEVAKMSLFNTIKFESDGTSV